MSTPSQPRRPFRSRRNDNPDKRAHLDLQVDLLAEQEMTVVLRMLRELCDHFSLENTTASDEFRALIERTDVRDLAERVETNLHATAETGSS